MRKPTANEAREITEEVVEIVNDVTTIKDWRTSKVLIGNTIVIIGIILQMYTGHVVINPEIQALILSIANMVLRFYTKEPIV